ncbi:MAG: hypothetical protein QM751_01375 [Paludibacteraceae bacterium]
MKEITENGTLATLYKTKNENDLLEKFIVYLHNKETYKQKAEQTADLIKKKYSIQQHIKRLKEEIL